MGKNAFIKPRKTISLKISPSPKIKSEYSRPIMQRNGALLRHRKIAPDEEQTDTTTINPVYVLPDGSINYWAEIILIADSNPPSNKTEDK